MSIIWIMDLMGSFTFLLHYLLKVIVFCFTFKSIIRFELIWGKNIDLCLYSFFFFNLEPYPRHMEVSRLEVNWSCSLWPVSQPQLCQIQVESVTYTIAHGNTRSLTHWAGLGIKPTSSWILARFLTYWATTGTPRFFGMWIANVVSSVCWI